jgi:branched-chain amino acid transport system permease protein
MMIPQLLANGLVSGSLYALLAVSFSIIFSTTHAFHVAHAAVITVAAYGTLAGVEWLGLGHFAAITLGCTAAVGIGLIMDIGVYRRLRSKNASPLIQLFASLGLLTIAQNGVSLLFGADAKVLRDWPAREGGLILGARLTSLHWTIVLIALLLCAATIALLHFTRLGRVLRAVAEDPELARVLGVRVNTVIFAAFGIGSTLASAAGILAAYELGLTPTLGFDLLLIGMIAAVIGGIGSPGGAAVGGLMVGFFEHVALTSIAGHWNQAALFAVLLCFLLLRPAGLYGRALRTSSI